MTEHRTRITTEIDYDRPGRQLGYLRLIHSDHRHAFSVIPVPVAVLANGRGPTVVLSAGNHGDEYEGQVILHDLIRTLPLERLHGRLIVLPALNYPAVMAASRVSPLDDGNLNRAFPGDADGPPTAALAHYCESVVLPLADAAADLHSGGTSTAYVPCAYLHGGGGRDLLRRKLAGAKAFGAPFTVVASATSDNRSLSAACDRLGIPMVATELAGGAAVDRHALAIGRAGVLRLLHHVGVLADDPPREHFHATRLIAPTGPASSVMAPIDGVFEPFHDLEDMVRAGQEAGRVHPVGELDRPAAELVFAHDGMVMVRRVPALVRRGDYVYRLAVELDEAKLLA